METIKEFLNIRCGLQKKKKEKKKTQSTLHMTCNFNIANKLTKKENQCNFLQ